LAELALVIVNAPMAWACTTIHVVVVVMPNLHSSLNLLSPSRLRRPYSRWWINSNIFDGWKDLLFSFIKICIDSYIIFERFMQCRFSKLLYTYILLFKRCKYVSPQKLTFLVQNMTLQKWLQWISNIKIFKKHHKYVSIFRIHSKKNLVEITKFQSKRQFRRNFHFLVTKNNNTYWSIYQDLQLWFQSLY
jgi:hypothetical protein